MTKYTLEIGADEYRVMVSGLTWEEAMEFLSKVSYIPIGASIEISSYQEMK